MNKDIFQGQWNMLKGKIKENWGKLTEDDLTEINGKRDQLLGKLQKKYGYDKQKAELELKNWEHRLSSEFSKENESYQSFGGNQKSNQEPRSQQGRDRDKDRR